MNRRETAEIVKLLTAFFRNTNGATAVTMIDAWFTVLKDYDFKTTKAAVIRYAKSDQRDYPTMPGVGQIVGAIEAIKAEKEKPISEAVNALIYGLAFDSLSDEAKAIISRKRFEMYAKHEPEMIIARRDEIRAAFRREAEEAER